MNKFIIVVLATLFIVACKENKSTDATTPSTSEAVTSQAAPTPIPAPAAISEPYDPKTYKAPFIPEPTKLISEATVMKIFNLTQAPSIKSGSLTPSSTDKNVFINLMTQRN
jgi:hypothetical protein